MSSLSAPVLLVWTSMGTLLTTFYAFHLWAFDRFRCLRWSKSSHGKFKRVMTYSYMLAMPLLLVYTLGFTVILYQEGMVFAEGFGVIPSPYPEWSHAHRKAILPLYLCLSCAISFEVITHLEETCFWLYVVYSGPAHVSWFQSLHFKVWVIGSITAIIYAPLTTIFTRRDPFICEAATFLAFASGSGLVTILFFPVIFVFPRFLDSLRTEGVNVDTIVRLTKFHELNKIRVFFRLMFVIPVMILGLDGLIWQRIARFAFARDVLTVIPAISLTISSALTLTIFFPRSIEGELQRKAPKAASVLMGATGIQSQAVLSSHLPQFFRNQQDQSQVLQTYELRAMYDADYEDSFKDDIDEISLNDAPSSAAALWRRGSKLQMQPPSLSPPSPIYTQTEPAIGAASVEVRMMPDRRAATDGVTRSSPELGRTTRLGMSSFMNHLRSPIDFREGTTSGDS